MSARAAVQRGLLQLRTGRPHAAVDAFCEALSFDPDDADTHAFLALALLDARRLQTARIEAELAVGMAAESPLPLYALGRVRTGERRWKEAREVFERLLAVEPDDAENHRALAMVQRAEGRRAEARATLERARAVDPSSAGVMADLADLALDEGRLDEAEALARDALGEAPEHADALVVMGQVCLRRGRADEAWEHAVHVLRGFPDHVGATALLVAVKARRSKLLGLWWRYNTWMIGLGSRALAVLLVAFAVYKLASLLAADFGPEGLSGVVEVLWLGIVAYTWFGPAMFKRALDRELAPVTLKQDF